MNSDYNNHVTVIFMIIKYFLLFSVLLMFSTSIVQNVLARNIYTDKCKTFNTLVKMDNYITLGVSLYTILFMLIVYYKNKQNHEIAENIEHDKKINWTDYFTLSWLIIVISFVIYAIVIFFNLRSELFAYENVTTCRQFLKVTKFIIYRYLVWIVLFFGVGIFTLVSIVILSKEETPVKISIQEQSENQNDDAVIITNIETQETREEFKS